MGAFLLRKMINAQFFFAQFLCDVFIYCESYFILNRLNQMLFI